MAISRSETIRLRCPSCGAAFEAVAWALVDAAERPDLAAALRDGTLNLAECPRCGAVAPAGAALLFHDSASRRVYFAVPPDTGEHRWREQAQALLYELVGALPEDDRLPYLGDVQVEQELGGVRRAVLRRERGRAAAPARPPAGKPVESLLGQLPTAPAAVTRQAEPEPAGQATPTPDREPELSDAVRALLAADDAAEFEAIVAANPALLSEAGDAAVRSLADLAYAQGERAVSDALRELRATLARLRSGAPLLPPAADAPPADAPAEQPPGTRLPGPAYQALLHVASPETLQAAARDYPVLLEDWADAELAARTEAALDEGNERLAQLIDDRREALAQLRARLGSAEALGDAVRALLDADGNDAVAEVLGAHPMLLTGAAQAMLADLASTAGAQGQAELADDAARCRALLHDIRAGLDSA